jgi:outer membrane protein OmpA-like peptidoglycan-associated protein
MKKPILISFFIFCLLSISFGQSISDCDDTCKKNLIEFISLLKVPLVNKDLIKKIEKGKYVKVLNSLEKLNNKYKPFNDPSYGARGCFLFFYAYAKLAYVAEIDSNFRNELKDDYSHLQVIGKMGLKNAEKIIENECPNEPSWLHRYKSHLCTIRKKIHPYDLAVTRFEVTRKENKSSIEYKLILEIINHGDADIEKAFICFWDPDDKTKEENKKGRGDKITLDSIPAGIPIRLERSYEYTYDPNLDRKDEYDPIAQIILDPEKVICESNEKNNSWTAIVKKIDDKQGQGEETRINKKQKPCREAELIISNKEGSEKVVSFDITEGEKCCVVFSHQFDLGDIRTEYFEKINSSLFELISQYVESKGIVLSESEITVTGIADKVTIGDTIKLPQEIYTVLGKNEFNINSQNKIILPIDDNDELALARALLLAIQFTERLNISQNWVTINSSVKENETNEKFRKSSIEICFNEIVESDFESLIQDIQLIKDSSFQFHPTPDTTLLPPPNKQVKKETLPSGESGKLKTDQDSINSIELNIVKTDTPKVITFNPSIELVDLAEGQLIRLEDLKFEATKSELTEAHKKILDQVVLFLKEKPQLVVKVVGHTNTIADPSRANELSTKRAESVKNYLIKNGVEKTRVSAEGYGKRDPISSDQSKNQRVELKIVEIKE